MLSLSMGMIKYFQKLLEVKYLYHILKKKLGVEFIFCIPINVKVFISWHYSFWWKWPDMSNVSKIGSWKIVVTVLCSVVMQNIQIFYGGQVMVVVTCFISWDKFGSALNLVELQICVRFEIQYFKFELNRVWVCLWVNVYLL